MTLPTREQIEELRRRIVYQRDELDQGYFECPLEIKTLELFLAAAERAIELEGKLAEAEKELATIDEVIRGPKVGGDPRKARASVERELKLLSDAEDERKQREADQHCAGCNSWRITAETWTNYSVKIRALCKELRKRAEAAERELAALKARQEAQ